MGVRAEFDSEKFLVAMELDYRCVFGAFCKKLAALNWTSDEIVNLVVKEVVKTLLECNSKKLDIGESQMAICEVITSYWKQESTAPLRLIMAQAKKELQDNIGMDKMDSTIFRGYWHFFSKLNIHEVMLGDEARTKAYRNAILGNAEDFKGKVVMDLGAGTGMLGFFALQAGAKHVYSVEASSMAQVVRELAQHNGLIDRITIVNQVLQDITFETIAEQSIDIIVSETLSNAIFNEKGMETLFIARDRFLKKGGNVFPSSATLFLAPFSEENIHKKHSTVPAFWQQTNFHGIDFTPLTKRAIRESFRQSVTDFIDMKTLMAEPAKKTWCFKTMKLEDLDRIPMSAEWVAKRTGFVHGLAAWFEIVLDGPHHSETLSTGPEAEWTHWWQVRLLIEEPLVVNNQQKMSGELVMVNNDHMSYDCSIKIELPGTGIVRENPFVDLMDRDSTFQKCYRYGDRVYGVPYDAPANFVPSYLRPKEEALKFGKDMYRAASAAEAAELTKPGVTMSVSAVHQGRIFMTAKGSAISGLVEITPSGVAATATKCWVRQTA